MSLDFEKIAPSIADLVEGLKNAGIDRRKKLDTAADILKAIAADQEKITAKIETGKTTFLIADPVEDMTLHRLPPSIPDEYRVIATDGSHIDIDRHQSARCFLINIGIVDIQYGNNPNAELSAVPTLYVNDEDMIVRSTEGRQITMDAQLLGLKRTVEEYRYLADAVEHGNANLPSLYLMDGSLIMWGILGQNYDDFVIEKFIKDGFLRSVEKLGEIARTKKLALASYISYPRSTEIINILRLAVCPYKVVDCDVNCPKKYSNRECDAVGGLIDSDIISSSLQINERSAIFRSRSSIIDKYYNDQKVYFFYIRLEDEVARVEIPQWVVERQGLVDLVHSTILDQCRKGIGYPVALSEAHEKAVITGADRNQFWNLIDQYLVQDGSNLNSSAKQKSKRNRWI
jgi:hypothetical protein